jgi:predicted acetyltransferase
VPDQVQLAQRALTEADSSQVCDLIELVFASEPEPAEERAIDAEILEPGNGRGIGVFDGAVLAGVGTISGFEMAVPGGRLPMAAVTFIGVSPIFRRRGVMTSIIRHQLHTLHSSGAEPVAGLTASESVIYGRFGYGVATYRASFAVPRHRAGLRPVAGADQVRLRLIPTADSVEVCEAILARQVGTRAGMLVRPPAWGRAYAADYDRLREGRSVLRTVLASRAGEPAGYARYRTKNEASPSGIGIGYTDVEEIHADDAAVYAALLGYLTDIDLSGGARFSVQPVDGVLVQLLADFRAAEMHVRDGLYLRLVDVDRALAGRTYSASVSVVLEVTDEFCPWNAGSWQLSGDSKSASCTPTSVPADLSLDVRELAAAYLGGTTLAALGAAGLVLEKRPGALTEASRAFATDLAPWLPWGL